MSEMKYIFMVGYPRSGTTLAQSLVMCDKNVYSIPETHIFTKGLKYKRLPEFISNLWTSWYCYRWVDRCFGENLLIYSTSRASLIRSFFSFIEHKAKAENKSIILEKTPKHLNQIELISEIFPNAYFLHVVRKYKGAVPSMLKASAQWGGDSDMLPNMRRWLSEVYTSFYYVNTSVNHTLLEYEDIVAKRADVVEFLNCHLNLTIESVTDEKLINMSKEIIEPNENWKENNLKGWHDRSDTEIDIKFKTTVADFLNFINRTEF
jgi:hypothetical protein